MLQSKRFCTQGSASLRHDEPDCSYSSKQHIACKGVLTATCIETCCPPLCRFECSSCMLQAPRAGLGPRLSRRFVSLFLICNFNRRSWVCCRQLMRRRSVPPPRRTPPLSQPGTTPRVQAGAMQGDATGSQHAAAEKSLGASVRGAGGGGEHWSQVPGFPGPEDSRHRSPSLRNLRG